MKVFGNFFGFRLAFLNDFYNFLGFISFLTLLEKFFFYYIKEFLLFFSRWKKKHEYNTNLPKKLYFLSSDNFFHYSY